MDILQFNVARVGRFEGVNRIICFCVLVCIQRAALFEGRSPVHHLSYSCGGLVEGLLSCGESVGDIGFQRSQVGLVILPQTQTSQIGQK